MTLYNPSDAKASRIFRWIFWGIATVVAILWLLGSNNPNIIWSILAGAIFFFSGCSLVHALIVEPLSAKIKALEYKIDKLIRRLG